MTLTRSTLLVALIGTLVAGATTFSRAEPVAKPADGPTMATAVRMRVPAVEFKQVPLADVFEFMRDTAGLNLYVNWPALEAAGIDRSIPISIRLRNIPLSKVLDLTLSQISAGRSAITWYVSDNIIYVTTRELADKDLITRIYPVRDLIVQVPNFEPPTFQIGAGSGGGGEGGGGSIFSGTGGNPGGDDGTTELERGEKLVELIMMLVSPEVWVENGGYSRIRYFAGNLIVTAPRSVQAQIGK
jgi:hypothetical protein